MRAFHTILALLLSSWLCLGESFNSFKNFPVVGLKADPAPQEVMEIVEEVQEVDAVRAPRQAEILGYQDVGLDDTFIEEALFLTPEDREEREYTPKLEEWVDEEAEDDMVVRLERDGFGGHHGAGAHHGNHDMRRARAKTSGRRQGQRQELVQRQQVEQVERQQEREERQLQRQQEERVGRQTGAIAPALGLLSNPPNSDGDYNFNFSNEDGSSRQEVSGPQGVRGSYSFITPEGEEVSIQYIADESGFHATGSHVPQAPPMPPAIRRMLDHLSKVNGHAKLY